MPRVKLSKTTRTLMFVLQFYIVGLFLLILLRFLKLFG
jgi:hypothetical protein